MCWQNRHTFVWGSGTAAEAPPPGLRCECGVLTREDINPIARLQAEKEQLAIDLGEQTERALMAEAEVERLTKQLQIATDQLQAFSDQERERYPGEMGTFAHDALTQMSVVE